MMMCTEKKKINKKHHSVCAVLNSNRQIVETKTKSLPITHIYMANHSPGLVQGLDLTWRC